MFSHIFISVTEFDKAFSFYSPLMEKLGNTLKFCEREKPWAGWQPEGRARPLFIIGHPHDRQPHHPGNGQMVAFMANDRACVRLAYQIALQLGGTCDGPPDLRPHYHANYYGAYFRDPDGNKIAIACHEPEVE